MVTVKAKMGIALIFLLFLIRFLFYFTCLPSYRVFNLLFNFLAVVHTDFQHRSFHTILLLRRFSEFLPFSQSFGHYQLIDSIIKMFPLFSPYRYSTSYIFHHLFIHSFFRSIFLSVTKIPNEMFGPYHVLLCQSMSLALNSNPINH